MKHDDQGGSSWWTGVYYKVARQQRFFVFCYIMLARAVSSSKTQLMFSQNSVYVNQCWHNLLKGIQALCGSPFKSIRPAARHMVENQHFHSAGTSDKWMWRNMRICFEKWTFDHSWQVARGKPTPGMSCSCFRDSSFTQCSKQLTLNNENVKY